MLSLVLTVFFLNVAIYLVNTVGATTIDSLVRYLLLAWPDPKLTGHSYGSSTSNSPARPRAKHANKAGSSAKCSS